MRSLRPATFPSPFGLDVITTYATQIGATAIGLLISMVLARSLGPGGKGAVDVVQLLVLECAGVASLGVAVSVVYHVSKGTISTASIAGSVLWLVVLIGIPVTVAIWILAPVLEVILLSGEGGSRTYFLLAAPAGVFFLLTSGLLALYRGTNDFNRYNRYTLLGSIWHLVALVLFVLVVEWSTRGAIFAFTVSSALMSALLVWRSSRDFGITLRFDPQVLRRLVGFNIGGHAGTVLQAVSYRLDVFIVAYFLPATQVGLYTTAAAVGGLLWFLPNAIGTVLLSRTPTATMLKANQRLLFLCRWIALLTTILGLGLLILARPTFALLFGPEFVGSARPFALLLPGVIALGLWKVVANDMAGRGRPIYVLYSAAPGAMATVGLNMLLVPQYGISGAAVASSAAYLITTTVILVFASRQLNEPLWRFVLPDRTMLMPVNRFRHNSPPASSTGSHDGH